MARAEEQTGPAPQFSRILPALIFTAITIVIIISRLYHPDANPAFVLCGFKTVLGLPCPGCGLTRSFCALAQGDLWAAFSFNLLGPLLFIFMLTGWAIAALALAGIRVPWQSSTRLLTELGIIKYTIITVSFYWLARIIFLLAIYGWRGTVGQGLLAQLWK
jgi:hypothetical protein